MKFGLANYKMTNGALDPNKMSPFSEELSFLVFVETGTYLGDTVDAMSPIFDKLFSMELSPELYERARARFSGDGRIEILLGNSAARLGEAARAIGSERAVYWLDAHWSGGNTAKADENTPINAELESIKSFSVGECIIMVDDLRYFIDVPTGFEVHEANHGYPLLRELLGKISALWPERFALINGDILFIFPESARERLEISPVLLATHRLRSGDATAAERVELEAVIAGAEGEERDVLLSLPDIFSHSLRYGIGGEYLYWRSLVRQRDGALDSARADLDLARRCGHAVPARDWE